MAAGEPIRIPVMTQEMSNDLLQRMVDMGNRQNPCLEISGPTIGIDSMPLRFHQMSEGPNEFRVLKNRFGLGKQSDESSTMHAHVHWIHKGTKYQHGATKDCPICIGAAVEAYSKFDILGG